MFTGIVEEVGQLQAMSDGSMRLKAEVVLKGIHKGDSIAVNGVCLTVTDFDAQTFIVDIMPETFRRTTLAELCIGSTVNLERALTLERRIGGHIVNGHIDGMGRIINVQEEKNARVFSHRGSGRNPAVCDRKGISGHRRRQSHRRRGDRSVVQRFSDPPYAANHDAARKKNG